MKIIESYGMLWKFSKYQFRRMLKRVAKGDEINFDKYGRMIGVIDYNFTDLTREMAVQILEREP